MRVLFLASLIAMPMAMASVGQADIVPVPRQKPVRLGIALAIKVPVPRPNPRRRSAAPSRNIEGQTKTPGADTASGATCQNRLKQLDIDYETLPAINDSGGCGSPAPLLVTGVAGVTLSPPATLNCQVAEGLHRWITQSVQPAARQRLKTEVTVIHVAASYVCRRRNNSRNGKLSEHAKANAIDMSGFSFARKDKISVGTGWGGLLKVIGLSSGGSFLGDIRKGACKEFTTVLGPGSDSHHGNHFHLDAIQRRNGYRICK